MQKFEAMTPLLLRRLRVPALLAFGFIASAFGETLVGNSPFASAGKGAGSAGGPAEAYELAGSTSQGSQVSVCIFERQNKRSRWIDVGETVDGIQVVSYDSVNDSAVVAVNGTRKDLSMRKETVASSGPAYNPAVAPVSSGQVASMVPVPAQVTAAPGTPAAEQREARMLVSDLLEIGIQQRKAYQDAKQKAASASAPQPSN
jgi:hypothetical protein